MEFFTRYTPPPKPKMLFTEPSLTEQCHKDECDINRIIDRFERTGDISALGLLQTHEGFFADVTEMPTSFMDMQDRIARGKSIFDSLPSDLRLKFGNNANVFVDFVTNPENEEECRKLGLLPAVKTADRDSSLLDRTVTTDTEPGEVEDEKK